MKNFCKILEGIILCGENLRDVFRGNVRELSDEMHGEILKKSLLELIQESLEEFSHEPLKVIMQESLIELRSKFVRRIYNGIPSAILEQLSGGLLKKYPYEFLRESLKNLL